MFQLISGCYRASRDKQRIHVGLCVWCRHRIYPPVQVPCRPQLEDKLPSSPCCNLLVHPECKSPPQCGNCYQLLWLLPCVICHRPTARGEDFAVEYEAALLYRSPCCGADCHPQCKICGDTSCPLCSTPLRDWEVDKESEMAGDIQEAWWMRHVNNFRRYQNLPYEVIPPFHTPMWKPKY